MKKSIKKIILLALVMTMLLSTMMVVSAEGTIATEDVSFEEELMPLAATNCLYTSARGYSGKTYSFTTGSSYIYLHKGVYDKSGDPDDSNAITFVSEIQTMAYEYEHLTAAEKILWISERELYSEPISACFLTWYRSENRAEKAFNNF